MRPLKRKVDSRGTPRRNLSAEMASPWPAKGPTFVHNENLAAAHTLFSGKNLRLNPASRAMPHLLTPCVNPCGKSLVLSFYPWTESYPVQSELHNSESEQRPCSPKRLGEGFPFLGEILAMCLSELHGDSQFLCLKGKQKQLAPSQTCSFVFLPHQCYHFLSVKLQFT